MGARPPAADAVAGGGELQNLGDVVDNSVPPETGGRATCRPTVCNLVASTVASEWRTHRPNLLVRGGIRIAMGRTLALASSDGRFNVTVADEDVELVASVLLMLEVFSEEQPLDVDRKG